MAKTATKKQAKKPNGNPQVKAAYTRGKKDGILEESKRNELEKIHSLAMAGPLKTASMNINLFDNNECTIHVSGDFSVILSKVHEISTKSINIDKGEFFAVAAKMMAGKEGK